MSIHQCPVAACRAEVNAAKLMCRPHWYMVPKAVQKMVWATYADGSGVGSLAHMQAMRTAIAVVDTKLAGRR